MSIINLVTLLTNKGIIVNIFENKGEEYREWWIENFIKNPSNQNEKILWHFFSSEKLISLEKKEANTTFDKVNKQFCYIFFQESNDVLQVEFASSMKSKDFVNRFGEYSDVYVVDKGFNWTYIVPHEQDWGPYFYRK